MNSSVGGKQPHEELKGWGGQEVNCPAKSQVNLFKGPLGGIYCHPMVRKSTARQHFRDVTVFPLDL